MPQSGKTSTRILVTRALIEISGIMFLFYANLLMGEFNRSSRPGKTLEFALHDIFTKKNFTIGIVAATAGFAVFEYFRHRLMEAERQEQGSRK